ncbi:unnamed protein product [Calypogeia fissa]
MVKAAAAAAAAVPSFFTCPISLEVMTDPVTLSTGQTYERRSIEQWFESGHNTCPSTMQELKSKDVNPNHTLQRLIQHWCATNNLHLGAVEELPLVQLSRKQQAEPKKVERMLKEISAESTPAESRRRNLKKLRSLAKVADNHENRRILREAGAIPILANYVFSPENLGKDLEACEEALGILTLLPLRNIRKEVHIGTKQLTAISWLLNRGTMDGRVNGALFLSSLASHDVEMKSSVGATAGVFQGLVQLITEDLYARAMGVGLKTLLAIIYEGPERNLVRAVKAGVVFAVAERLPEAEQRSKVRSLTSLLELLCSCPEGREAVRAHALIVPVLGRIISLGDDFASEKAISCLWTLCQSFPENCVSEAAGLVGILTQLSKFAEAGDNRICWQSRQRASFLYLLLRHRLQNCDPISL